MLTECIAILGVGIIVAIFVCLSRGRRRKRYCVWVQNYGNVTKSTMIILRDGTKLIHRLNDDWMKANDDGTFDHERHKDMRWFLDDSPSALTSTVTSASAPLLGPDHD